MGRWRDARNTEREESSLLLLVSDRRPHLLLRRFDLAFVRLETAFLCAAEPDRFLEVMPRGVVRLRPGNSL
jgi:hypothetical protein